MSDNGVFVSCSAIALHKGDIVCYQGHKYRVRASEYHSGTPRYVRLLLGGPSGKLLLREIRVGVYEQIPRQTDPDRSNRANRGRRQADLIIEVEAVIKPNQETS